LIDNYFAKQKLKEKSIQVYKGGNIMIEKTTKIGELLEIAPEKANILLEAGMHCLGCLIADDETLEQACAVHGINVDDLLEELNK
jgi:hybrid cluster-associated redox disulfide protein